jgi:hypothetical protein
MTADPYCVLVQLPNDIAEEKLLAYCAALQAFSKSVKAKTEGWNTIYKGQEKMIVPVELTVTCTDEWHRKVIQEIVNPHKLLYISPALKGFNYVVDLRNSQAEAQIYAERIHKHFSQILGILIGAETPALPDVQHIPKVTKPDLVCDVLLTPKAELWMRGAKFEVESRVLNKNCTFETLCAQLNSCKLLIGEVSLETYLASSFNVPVMELTEASIGRTYLSKFTSPNYRQYIVADREKCSPAFLMRLQTLWHSITNKQQSHSPA